MKKNFFSFILAGAGAATILMSCNDGAETTTTETTDTTTTVVEQTMTPKEEEGIIHFDAACGFACRILAGQEQEIQSNNDDDSFQVT